MDFFSVYCYISLSFLIFLVISLCVLVSLDKSLSILLIFSKNQLFVSLIFLYCSLCFCFIDCNPEFDYFLTSTHPTLAFSFSFRAYRCVVNLILWEISNLIMNALSAMNIPRKTVFNVFFILGYAAHSLSLNSRKSLSSFFISALFQLLFRKELFSFHEFVGFLLFY